MTDEQLNDPLGHHRIIDLAAVKKHDREWTPAYYRNIERGTAGWFTWMNWLLARGALVYLATKTHSAVLRVLAGISQGLLWMYIVAFMSSIRIEPITSKLYQSHTILARVGQILW